ncbi:MAG: hypothetical protein JW888_13045 [Pirellulales bacterium]|nr:hypothetical protein [Pirellulales bacterium]
MRKAELLIGVFGLPSTAMLAVILITLPRLALAIACSCFVLGIALLVRSGGLWHRSCDKNQVACKALSRNAFRTRCIGWTLVGVGLLVSLFEVLFLMRWSF